MKQDRSSTKTCGTQTCSPTASALAITYGVTEVVAGAIKGVGLGMDVGGEVGLGIKSNKCQTNVRKKLKKTAKFTGTPVIG
jgi:type 1 fimbria pilin